MDVSWARFASKTCLWTQNWDNKKISYFFIILIEVTWFCHRPLYAHKSCLSFFGWNAELSGRSWTHHFKSFTHTSRGIFPWKIWSAMLLDVEYGRIISCKWLLHIFSFLPILSRPLCSFLQHTFIYILIGPYTVFSACFWKPLNLYFTFNMRDWVSHMCKSTAKIMICMCDHFVAGR